LACGASSVGQGVDTVLSQVVSEVLDIHSDRIRVVRGRTDQFIYGRGAFATRQSVMVGSAAWIAAEKLREKAFRVCAATLKVSVEELEMKDGAVRVASDPVQLMSLSEIADMLAPARADTLKEEPGLSAD